MYEFSFERLQVWQRSRTLYQFIFEISKKFPLDERFGATQQIRRAALSITCNLAEGSSRHKSADKARFTEIAYGSLMETLNILVVSVDIGFIQGQVLEDIRPLIQEIANKLNKLRESQLKLNESK